MSATIRVQSGQKAARHSIWKTLMMETVNDIGRFPMTLVQVTNQSNSISKEVATI